jgi:hypothetical protein
VKGRFESIDKSQELIFFFSFELFFIEYAEEEESEEEAEKIIIEKKTIIFHSTGGPPNLFNVGLYMLRALCVYIYRRGGGEIGFHIRSNIYTHTHSSVYTLCIGCCIKSTHNFLCRIPAPMSFSFHHIHFFCFPISPPGCIIYLIFVWPTVGVSYKKK